MEYYIAVQQTPGIVTMCTDLIDIMLSRRGRHKAVYTVWLHLYKVQEQVQVVDADIQNTL